MIKFLNLSIDRGNLLAKTAEVLVNKDLKLRKSSSMIAQTVTTDSKGILLPKKKGIFLCGSTAINCASAEQHSPLNDDKTTKLWALIAQSIVNACGDSTYQPHVNLAISLPSVDTRAIGKVYAQVETLLQGFTTTDGVFYQPKFNRVGVFQEGGVFLECHPEYNGCIDFGSGTIQGFIRTAAGKTHTADATGGSTGGANRWILDMIESDSFGRIITEKKCTKGPSPQQVAVFLGEGLWNKNGFDFVSLLKKVGSGPLNRVLNTASAMDGVLKIRDESYCGVVNKKDRKYALIGGGACLLKGVLSESEIQKLEDRGIHIIDTDPDFANVISMNEILYKDQSKAPLFVSKADKAAVKAKAKAKAKAKTTSKASVEVAAV